MTAGPAVVERSRTLAHPGTVAVAAAAVSAVAWVIAARRPIASDEVEVFRRFNAAPEWVAHGVWPVMQLGTLWAPIVAALVIGVWRRDRLLAMCMAGAGTITWIGTRVLKEIADRGRPAAYLDDVVLRDGWARGLGFPSGHSAMAAMIATVAVAAIPRRWRGVLVAVAAIVGIARLVHGVHLPVDLLGGWAFGVLVGVGALAVYDRARGVVATPR
jgi:membrane-associated phospholipid phosphatase